MMVRLSQPEDVLHHGGDCPVCGDLLEQVDPDGGVTQFAPFLRCATCLGQFAFDGTQHGPSRPESERPTTAGITRRPSNSK